MEAEMFHSLFIGHPFLYGGIAMSFTIPRFKSHFFLGRPTRKEDEPLMSGLDLSFQYSHERGILLQDLDELQVLLISLLDGHHTFDEIVAQLHAHDAAITADDVNAI